jgi:hypothetical protein
LGQRCPRARQAIGERRLASADEYPGRLVGLDRPEPRGVCLTCGSPAERGDGADGDGASATARLACLDVDGIVRAVRRPFELVAENCSRHFEHADDVRPIVGRRDLDPAGELSSADAYEVT